VNTKAPDPVTRHRGPPPDRASVDTRHWSGLASSEMAHSRGLTRPQHRQPRDQVNRAGPAAFPPSPRAGSSGSATNGPFGESTPLVGQPQSISRKAFASVPDPPRLYVWPTDAPAPEHILSVPVRGATRTICACWETELGKMPSQLVKMAALVSPRIGVPPRRARAEHSCSHQDAWNAKGQPVNDQ